MALSDPQSITVNAVAQSMARTGASLYAGSFQHADSTYFLDITHQIGRRNRHIVRFTGVKTTADPTTPSNNTVVSMTASLTIDMPKQGYTAAEGKLHVDGLVAWLAASSGAVITKLIGNES